MNKRAFLSVLTFATFEANAQLALEDVDVLVVFDIPAHAAISDKNTWVEAREDLVNALLDNSPGGSALEFDFHASEYVVPYSAVGKDSETVRDWMEGLQGSAIWASIRGDNDLVLMVVADWDDVACGIASEQPDDISIANSLTNFVAAIQLSACTNLPGEVLVHELGHLLAADHQLLYFADGSLDIDGTQGPGGTDVDIFAPLEYNHAWSTVDDSAYTLMGIPVSASRTRRYFSSGDINKGEDPVSHDVMKVFGDGTEMYGPATDYSWTTVSRYRPMLQAPEPLVFVMPCFCVYKTGYQELTWTSSDWSVPGQSFVVQKQSVSGNWTNVWEGDPECLIMDAPIGGVLYRIKIIVEGMLDSMFVEVSLGCNCLNGDPPGGPPL